MELYFFFNLIKYLEKDYLNKGMQYILYYNLCKDNLCLFLFVCFVFLKMLK